MAVLGERRMQKLGALCVTILLFALYSYGQEAPLKMGPHGNGTFVGLVSDTTCGARHRLKDKSAEECTRTCVRQGAGFALVAGPKVYVLQGNSNDLGVLAGQKVKVTGSLAGNTIAVSSITPTQ
jgi:hypothetical protein